MAITLEQDAELFLRRTAHDMAQKSRHDERLQYASQELLLAAEEHLIGIANLLEAAADWIRDHGCDQVDVTARYEKETPK